MYLPLQRAFVRCSGLYTPSDSHCLGFPNELKFKNGENGLDLTNPEMQDSMKRTKNWFMLAWWKTSNCYEDEPMMLDTFIWNSIVRRVSQLRNIQVQCCPYLGGGVRISFFVLHTIDFYLMGKGISISSIKIDWIHHDGFPNQMGCMKKNVNLLNWVIQYLEVLLHKW